MNASKHTTTRMRVLVIGGGFAGATTAVRLAGRARDRVAVTLVNPRAEFVNRIRLHQVALGDPVPSRSLPELLGSDIDFVEGRVAALDPDAGRAEVATADGTRRVPFDRVVIAAGSGTEHAPIPGGEHVRGIGDVDTARALRPELAALPAGSVVTVVGGGLTGLESASEFAEFRPDLRVRLVTAGEVGGWFTERGADYVRATLRELGVEAIGGVRVREADAGRLRLDGGAELDSDLTVWCGGFAAPPLAREAGITVDEQGAVLTDATLRSVSHPSVLAVGDSGHAPGPDGGRYSMSCQYAFPSGAHAADVLRDEALGTGDDPAFRLGFVGRCVSLGRRAAVLQLTDAKDRPAGHRVLTGRTAVAFKRIQFAGMLKAVAAERRMPGLIRWPSTEHRGASEAHPVAG